MAVIHVHRDHLNPQLKDSHNVGELNLKDWLVSDSNLDPNQSNLSIYVNDCNICDSAIFKAEDCEKLVDLELSRWDVVNVYVTPQGLDPVGIGLAASFTLVGIAITALVPKPDIPNLQGQQSTSPNNQLKSATNGFRINQAIADIYGKRRVTPDFAAPPYHVYENNFKVQKEIFVIGEGIYDFTDARFGESLVSTLPDATATFYDPGDNLPQDQRLTVVGSNSVDGQDLIAPNDDSLQQTISASITANNVIEIDNEESLLEDFGIGATDGLLVDFSAAGGVPNEFNGLVTITNIFDNGTNIEITVSGTPFSGFSSFPQSDSDTIFTKNDASNPGTPEPNVTDWFVLDGEDPDDIWLNIQMPSGIQTEDAKRLDVDIEINVREVGNLLPDYTWTVTISGNTRQAQYRTFKFSDQFPVAVLTGQQEVNLARTNNRAANDVDDLKIEEIYSVFEYSDAELMNDNFSMAYLERRATLLAVAPQSPKFNVVAQRKLRLFNTGSGTVDPTETATRSFADAVFHILYFKVGLPLDVIDTDSLFGIRDNLAQPYLGYFDYSFDDKNIDSNQRIVTACDAARVLPFKVGARIWTFVRDEEKPVRSALLNRRNMPPKDSTQAWSFRKPQDYDGVAITYVDFEENAEVTIYRSVDSSGNITTTQGVNSNEFTLSGVIDDDQANNRADFEIRKIKYQRITVKTQAMNDGLYIGLGDRIGWADINDDDIFDGEILNETGGNYDTSERFLPDGVSTYYCYLTDNEGVPTGTPFTVTSRPDTDFGFIATSGLAYLPTGVEQIGSRYIIAKQSDLDISDFTVTSRGGRDRDGNVQLEMVNYDARVYSEDP